MAYGKAIELFLVNGTADSLITAELSNVEGQQKMIGCMPMLYENANNA